MMELPVVNQVAITPDEGQAISFLFGKIHYTQDDIGKAYEYTVTESGNVDKVINAEPITITVTVEDNGDGTLTINKDKSGVGLIFVNKYVPDNPPDKPSDNPDQNRGVGTGDTMGMGALLLTTLSAICALATLLRRRKEEEQ